MSARRTDDDDESVCESCAEPSDSTFHCARCDKVHCKEHTIFLQDYDVDCSDALCACCAIALIHDMRAKQVAANRVTMLSFSIAEKHCYSLLD
jgi:hypothetical protein